MKVLTSLVLLLFCAKFAYSQETVKFCDLVRNPEKYNGKAVTVRATYHFGFEWSQLYCLDCLDRGRAWIDFEIEDMSKSSERAVRRLARIGSGTANITVHGVFLSGDHYGHLNGYRHRFVADNVTDVKVLVKGMKKIEAEEAIEKECACGGVHPL